MTYDYVHTLFNGMLSGITHDMKMNTRRHYEYLHIIKVGKN